MLSVSPIVVAGTTASSKLEGGLASHAALPPALLLEVFAEPIMFHRCFVSLTGSVSAALVLSYASYATEEAGADENGDGGWITKTVAQWQRDTGLTRNEVEKARRKLKAQGLLEERRLGPPPAGLQFRINQLALRNQLRDQALAQWGDRG